MNDRCRGTLIGLAVGDALGAAVEFRSPGSFTPVTGYRDGGPMRFGHLYSSQLDELSRQDAP